MGQHPELASPNDLEMNDEKFAFKVPAVQTDKVNSSDSVDIFLRIFAVNCI